MTALKHAWVIAAKDVKGSARDRTTVFFNLLFPFLFVALFGHIMAGIGSEDSRLELHVVTQEDNEGLGYHIARAMETDDEAELDAGEPLIVWDRDYDEALRAVSEKRLDGFLLLPDGFSEGISRGYGSVIDVVSDSEAIYARAALDSVADSIAYQIGLQQVVRRSISGLMLDSWLDSAGDTSRIGEQMPAYLSVQAGVPMRSSLVEYEVEKVGDVEAEEPATYVIPGYLVMFTFMAAANSAEIIVRERQNRTLERLLAASVKREAILAGTFGGIAFKGLVQIALFWIVGLLFFHLDLGASPAAVILLSVVMVVMSAAFALMLATLARTQRSAGSIATVTSLVLAPLGGCWWPLFITPRWMQYLAKLTPHGWATTGFNKLLIFGADFGSAVPEMLAVLAFGVIFAAVAVLRFRTSAV